ncbi:MAG: hypothetical protein Q4A11_02480 [Brachymonas sp.]|nr:hypothetical protein [Brachymonas sp.]
MTDKLPNYWVVGATWGGKDDALPRFLKRGYWYCFDVNECLADDAGLGNSISVQQERFREIKSGDRIAVKRLLGQGASEMDILAIGVVKDVDDGEWRIYIDWRFEFKKGERRVPLRGCTASVHGPYQLDDAWVHQIFCI